MITSLQILILIPTTINKFLHFNSSIVSNIVAFLMAEYATIVLHMTLDHPMSFTIMILKNIATKFQSHHSQIELNKLAEVSYCIVYFTSGAFNILFYEIYTKLILFPFRKNNFLFCFINQISFYSQIIWLFHISAHYVNHNTVPYLLRFIQKIFLDPEIHSIHHSTNSTNYGFTNISCYLFGSKSVFDLMKKIHHKYYLVSFCTLSFPFIILYINNFLHLSNNLYS